MALAKSQESHHGRAVAADEADLVAVGDGDVGAVQDRAPLDAVAHPDDASPVRKSAAAVVQVARFA